jgi:hypothetical protein
MILSKFGDWFYSITNDIMECDENWESDVIIIQTNNSSQSALVGKPVEYSGVIVSNIYDEAMNRIGILEKNDMSEEYLFFDGWKNTTALLFQSDLFQSSTLELKDLVSDKTMFKWNTWVEQYYPNITQTEVDVLFRKMFPYTIIDMDSLESSYQTPKSGIIFLEENSIVFWDSRPINQESDFPEYILKYLKNPKLKILF